MYCGVQRISLFHGILGARPNNRFQQAESATANLRQRAMRNDTHCRTHVRENQVEPGALYGLLWDHLRGPIHVLDAMGNERSQQSRRHPWISYIDIVERTGTDARELRFFYDRRGIGETKDCVQQAEAIGHHAVGLWHGCARPAG